MLSIMSQPEIFLHTYMLCKEWDYKKIKQHQPKFREIRIIVRGGYAGTVTVGMQKYVSALKRAKPARFANPI